MTPLYWQRLRWNCPIIFSQQLFLTPYIAAPGFEPMSVELHQTGTIEERSTYWATAPRPMSQQTGQKTEKQSNLFSERRVSFAVPDQLRVAEAGGGSRSGRRGGHLTAAAVLEAVVRVVGVGRLGSSPRARVEVRMASGHPAVGWWSSCRFAEWISRLKDEKNSSVIRHCEIDELEWAWNFRASGRIV